MPGVLQRRRRRDARDQGGRKRKEEREGRSERVGERRGVRVGTGSVATPNFNSLITGARATSCQGARIFQTIVFVNPSGLARAGRPYICARNTYVHTDTRTRVQTHLGFAFTTNPSALCPSARERIRSLSFLSIYLPPSPLSLTFLFRESPSVCQWSLRRVS